MPALTKLLGAFPGSATRTKRVQNFQEIDDVQLQNAVHPAQMRMREKSQGEDLLQMLRGSDEMQRMLQNTSY